MNSKQEIDASGAQVKGLAIRYDEMFDGIRSIIVQVLGISSELVVPQAKLLELGAQSFDFIQVVFRLEKTYDVELPRAYAIPDQHTVDTYVQVLVAALAQRDSTLGGCPNERADRAGV
jgi:acyl carrier protein